MAPTAMNTVPSGSELVFMYGAPASGGTEAGMILYAPARVGSPEGNPASSASPEEPVIVGTAAVWVSSTPPVITLVNEAVLDGPFVTVPVPLAVTEASDRELRAADSSAIALDKLGNPVSCADVATSRSDPARAVEKRMFSCGGVCVFV